LKQLINLPGFFRLIPTRIEDENTPGNEKNLQIFGKQMELPMRGGDDKTSVQDCERLKHIQKFEKEVDLHQLIMMKKAWNN